MEFPLLITSMLAGCAVPLAFGAAPPSDLFGVDVRELAAAWEREHTSPADPYALRHRELGTRLKAIQREFPGVVRVAEAGRSVQGREIFRVSLGSGRERILLWSQMHGDEPTATCSLLDLFRFFGIHGREPWAAAILERYTLEAIPMLNPDGAERGERRNAQGIDVNRDARALQTPEGRLLKKLRDDLQPILGFNLHNQNAQTTVGDTGKVATIALLAVAADAGAARPAAQLAKQVTAVLYEALAPFVYGHVSRYDEDFNPRAFGDNLTLWGTPVVLIESGGLPAGAPPLLTVELNVVGLLAVLDSLASGRIRNANPGVFDGLRRNSDAPVYDLMLRNGWIATGTGVPLFRGDVAVRRDLRRGGGSIIADVGDLGVFQAHETIDCAGKLVTPGLVAWSADPALAAGARDERGYLARGVTALLETVDLRSAPADLPADLARARTSSLHWGYVVSGEAPRSAEETLRLAAWLAGGARGWLGSAREGTAANVPGWFGIELVPPEEARGLALAAALRGEPAAALPRYTSEAARRFRLGSRGAVAPGFAADLVVWSTPDGGAPREIGDCRVARVILDGRPIDPAAPGSPARGRFLR
jgi:hypothetical protein